MSFLSVLRLAFNDEFCSVALPRKLVIQNVRLGMLFRLLQFIFLAGMLTICFNGKVWRRASPAQAFLFSVWSEGLRQGGVPRPDAAYCAEPRTYHFNHTGQARYQAQYAPTGCRTLLPEEAAVKDGRAGEIFITTMVKESNVWKGTGTACNPDAKLACEGGTPAGLYTASGGDCTCTARAEYFAQDAEEQTIRLHHGYDVDTSNGNGAYFVRGSSLSPKVQQGPPGQEEERLGDMTTVFRRKDGSKCSVGGRSEWSQGDALGGISGTLGELLACAGLTLDSDPRSLLASPEFTPHIRTMGIGLNLDFQYKNTIFDNKVYCDVRVSAHPIWTWRETVDALGFPVGADEETPLHLRKAYGVGISMKAAGYFYRFDFVQLLHALASMIVMVQVPRYITQFIALYCLGLISDIYRNAKNTKLNICERFHGACARMMLGEIGFRGLMGGQWTGEVAHMPGLSELQLYKQLTSVFHEHLLNGVLQDHELRKMTSVIFHKMDTHKTGAITCSDFVSACVAGDTIDVRNMARFFDDDKKVGLVESYFDEDIDELKRTYMSESSLAELPPDDPRLRRGNTVRHEEAPPDEILIAGRLEADDVREIVAECLDHVHGRLAALESPAQEKRLQALQQKADSALTKAMQACIVAAKRDEAVAEVAEGSAKLRSLMSKVQQLEEDTALAHANLEARTSELEQMCLRAEVELERGQDTDDRLAAAAATSRADAAREDRQGAASRTPAPHPCFVTTLAPGGPRTAPSRTRRSAGAASPHPRPPETAEDLGTSRL